MPEVSYELDGITYNGAYSVRNGMITVKSEFGTKTTIQIGGTPPQVLARIILGEMVRTARAS
jgi:hypothetical protein